MDTGNLEEQVPHHQVLLSTSNAQSAASLVLSHEEHESSAAPQMDDKTLCYRYIICKQGLEIPNGLKCKFHEEIGVT